MKSFEVVFPERIEQAASALKEAGEEGKAIAGGTALLVLMKNKLYSPKYLVSLRKIDDLKRLAYTPGVGLIIGSGVTEHELEAAPFVRDKFPVIAQAAHAIGNIRIRNVATIGGNLAHADYQCDPPAALIAMGAEVKLYGPDGERIVALEDFFLGPYETVLHRGEIITQILVPDPPQGARGRYFRFTSGSAADRPCVSVAVCLAFEQGVCSWVRVALGAVAPTPIRVREIETLLEGKVPDRRLIDEAAQIASASCEPLSDTRGTDWYKREMVRVLVQRSLQSLISDAGC